MDVPESINYSGSPEVGVRGAGGLAKFYKVPVMAFHLKDPRGQGGI